MSAAADPPAAPPAPGGGIQVVKPGLSKVPTGPITFAPTPELQRVIAMQLSNAKKTNKTSGDPPYVVIGTTSRPAGTELAFLKSEQAMKSTMSATFAPEAPRLEVTIPVRASNLYVLDCPVRGSSSAHYRVSFKAAGTTGYAVRETRSDVSRQILATHLADRDGSLRVIIEGYTLDGEDYLWNVESCRLTTVAYS